MMKTRIELIEHVLPGAIHPQPIVTETAPEYKIPANLVVYGKRYRFDEEVMALEANNESGKFEVVRVLRLYHERS